MEEDWGWNADDGNGGGECRGGEEQGRRVSHGIWIWYIVGDVFVGRNGDGVVELWFLKWKVSCK